jgi:putative aldouronate transport system substrate-binding protein
MIWMKRILLTLVLFLIVGTLTVGATGQKEGAGKAAAAPVVLEVYSAGNTSGLLEGWWIDVLKKEIGVQIDQLPSGDQGAQKFQAMMASGELPDIVGFGNKGLVEDAIRGKMLLCIDDYLDKLPNVKQNVAKGLQYFRDNVSAGTGKAYAVPNAVGPAYDTDQYNWGPGIRWDLYKKLGMPTLNVLEDYLPLLKKMQDLEPKNADGQPVYGFTLWKDWDGYQMFNVGGIANLIGYDNGDQLGGGLPLLQVDLHTMQTKSNLDADSVYLRTLKFYFQANQMGLVDPDSLTQRWESAWAKINAYRVLFQINPWFSGKPEDMNADSPKGIRIVMTKEGKPCTSSGDLTIGYAWPNAIGAATKQRDAALRYLNFLYSTDGAMTLYSGPKGVMWDVDSKGLPFYTEQGWDIIDNNKDLPGGGKLGDGSSVLNNIGLNGGFINPKYNATLLGSYWPSSIGHKPTKLYQDWQTTTGYKSFNEMAKAKNQATVFPLELKLIPPLPEDIQTLATQIGNVVKTNSWQMIFAKDQAEFDRLYKDMVDKANGLGIDTLIAYDNKAWQQAMAMAAKYR